MKFTVQQHFQPIKRLETKYHHDESPQSPISSHLASLRVVGDDKLLILIDVLGVMEE